MPVVLLITMQSLPVLAAQYLKARLCVSITCSTFTRYLMDHSHTKKDQAINMFHTKAGFRILGLAQ